MLRREIVDVTNDEIRLRNGVVIGIHSNSFRSIRSRTLLACIFDEVSFWRDDSSATPDTETYTAILPSLVRPNSVGLLVAISSPYRKTGLLYTKHKQCFGVDGDVLVVQGSSQQFNSTLTNEIIDTMKAADPTAAASEWDATFRADLQGFLDDAVIERCVNRNRPLELPPMPGVFYRCAVDVSGGAVGGDAYSICIVHREADKFVIDVCRGHFGPFDPAELTKEYAQLCRNYRIETVVGDNYSAEWAKGAWRTENMSYVPSDLNASMLYLEALPLFTRGLLELPDHPALLRELRLLERSPGKVGRDQVSHPRNTHDDLANACCAALRTLANYLGHDPSWSFVDQDTDTPAAKQEAQAARNLWEAQRLSSYINSFNPNQTGYGFNNGKWR